LSIPRAHARGSQTDYETLLALHHATCLSEVLVNTVKVIFKTHGFFIRHP
jgi:hypothetical protein